MFLLVTVGAVVAPIRYQVDKIPDLSATAPPQAKLEPKYRNPMVGAWPVQSVELFSAPNLTEQATFRVELDNRLGQSDVYIKLCAIKAACLRQAFLAKGETLTLQRIPRESHFLELPYIEMSAPDGIRVGKSFKFNAWQSLPVFELPKRPGDPPRRRDALHSNEPYAAVFTQIARTEF